MAEYLLPFNKQSIEEKREMFAVKNSMVNIAANFSSKSEFKCECGDKEDMKHIYECRIYNNENPEVQYEKIYNGNLNEQKLVFKKFQENMEKRRIMKEISYPCDQSDPLLYTH